jgi:hypothetical protein
MRISSAPLLLLLAGCSSGQEPVLAGEQIACALGSAASFSDSCTAERVSQDGKQGVIVRHADGGFRRFELLATGGVSAADGADAAVMELAGGLLEVTVGNDRYRFPVAGESKSGGGQSDGIQSGKGDAAN